MAQVYLSLGSNINRFESITLGLDALAEHYGELQLSSVYDSEAVGFAGDPFLNLVVGLQTGQPLEVLIATLRAIEDANGRCREGPRMSSRILDIDILTYDDRVGHWHGIALPREEICENAFVLWPLAELAGEALHPVLKQSYRQLWDAMRRVPQPLRPVDFSWRGHIISRAQDTGPERTVCGLVEDSGAV